MKNNLNTRLITEPFLVSYNPPHAQDTKTVQEGNVTLVSGGKDGSEIGHEVPAQN